MAGADEITKESMYSMFEKAVRPQFFLLSFGFLLLFDSVLLLLDKPGLIGILYAKEVVAQPLGLLLAVTFVIFSGLISLVLPVVFTLARLTYIEVVFWLNRHWRSVFARDENPPPHFPRFQRPFNYVRPSELREEAFKSLNEVLLGLYERYDAHTSDAEETTRKVSLYAFCALIFLMLNHFLPGDTDGQAMSRWGQEISDVYAWGAASILAVIVFIPVHQSDEDRWVYCPTLYRELQKSDDERLEQDRQYREEVERHMAAAKYNNRKGTDADATGG